MVMSKQSRVEGRTEVRQYQLPGGFDDGRDDKIHVHLENLSTKAPIFQLTKRLIDITRRNNRDLSQKVRFTVSTDFERFNKELETAHVLVTSSNGVCDRRFPRAELADAAPNLRFIHLIGAGVEDVLPLDWLPSSVRLTNNSGVHVQKAREFLLMGLLALNARLPAIVSNQRSAHWHQIFTPIIRGKKLLVIGLGDMGRAAVDAGTMLGLQTDGVSRSGRPVEGVRRVYQPRKLRSAVKDADFIVGAVPLTVETRNMINRQVLEGTKPGVGFINVGRAGILDHDALADLLTSGHASGAILDVFPVEPLPSTSRMWSTPNLIVSPHVSSDDLVGYMPGTMNLVCQNLRQLLAQRPLDNVVQPERGY